MGKFLNHIHNQINEKKQQKILFCLFNLYEKIFDNPERNLVQLILLYVV